MIPLLALAFSAAFSAPAVHPDAGQANPKLSARARQVMAEYAACLVNTEGWKLRKVLDMPVGPMKTQKALGELATANCLSKVASIYSGSGDVELKFSPALLRGAVYTVLYQEDFPKAPPETPLPDSLAAQYAGVSVQDAKNLTTEEISVVRSYAVSMDIGDCVVRAAPKQADALVRSDVESDAEASAISSLMPALTKCISKGQTVTLSKPRLRAMIAEPLYRIRKAEQKANNA